MKTLNDPLIARFRLQDSAPSSAKARRETLEPRLARHRYLSVGVRSVVSALAVLACSVMCASSARAGSRDRCAPSQPTQMQITALAAYQVSLSWAASSDNSGSVAYRVLVSDGRELAVGPGATSFRLGWGLTPSAAYSFAVVAVDPAGNRSRVSNVVGATLPADVTPPTAPSLAVQYAGSDKIALSWSASRDDGGTVLYELALDGNPVLSNLSSTTATLANLMPNTSYALSVRAKDAAGNWSLPSATLTVATTPAGTVDVTAPSTPAQLAAFEDYCGDVFVVWNESVDDNDTAAELQYDVYLNGSLQQTVQGRGWAAFNVSTLGPAELTVIAVDSAGNASSPASIVLDVEGCGP